MYTMMDAHPVTVIVIMSAFLVTPIYALATYTFSGASKRKGLRIGAAWLVFGGLMSWVCLARVPGRLGLPGNNRLTMLSTFQHVLARIESQATFLIVRAVTFKAIGNDQWPYVLLEPLRPCQLVFRANLGVTATDRHHDERH